MDVIQVDYERLGTVISQLEQRATQVATMKRQLEQALGELKAGGMKGKHADKLFERFDNNLIPSLQSLETAFNEAKSFCEHVKQAFAKSEEDAKSFFTVTAP